MNLYVNYPKINFKLDSYDSVRAIDITSSIRIKKFLKEYRGISYFPYVIQNGERPDTVSYKIYKDSTLDWLILLTNDMYNVYDDWPKDQETFNRYIIEKYGSISAASSEIKYYYDADGDIIDLTTYNSLSTSQRKLESAFDYEQRININKSKIKVVQPRHIGAIESQLNAQLVQPIR
jgi:hypothetical protein